MDRTTDPEIIIVPANEASWEDLQAIFGQRGPASRCFCQRFKFRDMEFFVIPPDERADLLHEEAGCGNPEAPSTNGLVAYLDGEPAGWCAVEIRTAYPRLRYTRVTWAGRDEDKSDDSVWAVTCFVTRAGYRKRGVSRALAAATIDYARERGARAVEGYPMIMQPGQEISVDEIRVGNYNIFRDAGFAEVSAPTKRRAVMRIDF